MLEDLSGHTRLTSRSAPFCSHSSLLCPHSSLVSPLCSTTDGLRQKHVDGDGTIYFVMDEQNVLIKKSADFATQAIYTTLPGAPGGLLSAKVGATHMFYIPDMQGHVRQVTDIDGDVIAEYQYDAWGLIQLTAASAMAFGDWGYTWDGKPGRYYVQQRHLRADLGRWMSVDPVETEPPYAYVGNRPTWGVDPSGEQGGTGGWYEWGRFKQEHREGLGVPLEQFLDMMVDLPLQAGETLWRGFIGWEAAVGDTALRILGVPIESALWSSMRHGRSSGVLALAPPQPGPNFVRWTGGLIWGLFETTAKMVLGLPADAVRLVKYLLKQGTHILGDLLQFIRSTWGSILKALPELSKLDEYTRGKTLGTIIASTIGLFLAGKGALALMKGLPVALKKGIEAARHLAESAAEAARGARFRIDPAFARDAWNRTWGDIGNAYREGTRKDANTRRVPQDRRVGPRAPQAKPPKGRRIGMSPAQAQALADDIENARQLGAYDVRVNQNQVNGAGVRVGRNCPDLQYTFEQNGRTVHYCIEYDRPDSPRGPQHLYRILSNDRSAKVILRVVQ